MMAMGLLHRIARAARIANARAGRLRIVGMRIDWRRRHGIIARTLAPDGVADDGTGNEAANKVAKTVPAVVMTIAAEVAMTAPARVGGTSKERGREGDHNQALHLVCSIGRPHTRHRTSVRLLG